MSNKILECNNLRKNIGQKQIVKDVSLSLYEGDILGFIGPNGAGKTTTLKLILGLQRLSSGSVSILGYDINKDFEKSIRNVGAIIESPDLYMYLSGYQNLKLVSKYYNISEDRIKEVVGIVGLSDSIYKQVKKYSLGMRQRLGIAQAILHKPKILILDEPMNGLDPRGIKDLKDLLLYLAKEEHIGIIISSHILSELEGIVSRVCIMYDGSVIKNVTREELFNEVNNNQYIIELSNININHILYQYEVIDNNHIRIFTAKDKLNNIIKTLIDNNINIYEVKREIHSLENIFMDITRGNNV